MSRRLYLDENYLSAIRARMAWTIAHELPQRAARRRCEVFSGRRPDVLRLRDRLQELPPTA